MALNNIRIRDVGGHSAIPTVTFPVAANATAINAGEFAIKEADNTPSVIVAPDAAGVGALATNVVFCGLAASTSTQTASAAGTVDLYMPLPGVIYEAKAKSAASADTAAEILALSLDYAILDVTAGVHTIDATGTTVVTAPFVIVGGDPLRSVLYFTLRMHMTYLGDFRTS